MPPTTAYALTMMAAGVGIPILAALNAQLGVRIGSPVAAAAILFCVAFTAASIENAQRFRAHRRQQYVQILPQNSLTQLPFGGAIDIARKLFRHVIKIAILHRASLLTSPATKGLFCHTHGENEATWCNIAAFRRSDA